MNPAFNRNRSHTQAMQTAPEISASSDGSSRSLALDVFRGLTIAAMIIVNNPGPSGEVYSALEHAEWHGWTPTDFIFPFFLFISGISIPLALAKHKTPVGNRGALYRKIFRRALLIYLLGFLLASYPFFIPDKVDLSGGFFSDVKSIFASSWELAGRVRLTGVLQRIAFCYLFATLIFPKFDWRKILYLTFVLLVGYWLVMTQIPFPFGSYVMGDLSQAGNLAAIIDRAVLGNHIWKGADRIFDPEGILSTLPAIATTLTGVLTGLWLMTERLPLKKIGGMIAVGAACVLAGEFWSLFFPINKALWTSSYVLLTTGLALEILALLIWIIDYHGIKRWAKPFEIFGVNALALFVGTGLMARTMMLIKLPRPNGKQGNLINWFYDHLFANLSTPKNSSLLYALAFLLVWLGILTFMYRKKIYFKV